MTRTTTSHHTAAYELSPVAALRALRSIAYRDWNAYRPAAETPTWSFVSEPEVSDVVVLDDPWAEEIDLRDSEGYALEEVETFTIEAVPAADISDGTRIWYLNEVPAEWIDDSFSPDHPSTPISA